MNWLSSRDVSSITASLAKAWAYRVRLSSDPSGKRWFFDDGRCSSISCGRSNAARIRFLPCWLSSTWRKFLFQHPLRHHVRCWSAHEVNDPLHTWRLPSIPLSVSRHIWNPMTKTHLGYNVLMFGFDSVSRMTFMRFLPKTYSYLIKQLGGVVLKGRGNRKP